MIPIRNLLLNMYNYINLFRKNSYICWSLIYHRKEADVDDSFRGDFFFALAEDYAFFIASPLLLLFVGDVRAKNAVWLWLCFFLQAHTHTAVLRFFPGICEQYATRFIENQFL